MAIKGQAAKRIIQGKTPVYHDIIDIERVQDIPDKGLRVFVHFLDKDKLWLPLHYLDKKATEYYNQKGLRVEPGRNLRSREINAILPLVTRFVMSLWKQGGLTIRNCNLSKMIKNIWHG